MSNITLNEYVRQLQVLTEEAAGILSSDPTNIIKINNYNLALEKYNKGLRALEVAANLITLKDALAQANANALNANNVAKDAKIKYDTAIQTYNSSPTEGNKTLMDAAESAYETKLELSVQAAATASTLTMEYNQKEKEAIEFAKSIGYMYPISLPSDAEILQTLTVLINEGCMDVTEIQTKITEIVTTSNTFNVFIEQMSVFNDYEDILEIRLRQIFNFLVNDAVIDSQEIIITTLRTEIIKAINDYKAKVINNNSLATQVNTLYKDVEQRLDNLHVISTEISQTMDDVKKLILLKRGGQEFAKKIVFVPIICKIYSFGNIVPLQTSRLTLISPSIYQMRYNFRYDDANKKIIYKGTSAVTVEMKIEVLSTNYNTYDTSSIFSVVFKSKAGQIREKQVSCVCMTGSIYINPDEEMQVYFKEGPKNPLEVKEGMLTICIC